MALLSGRFLRFLRDWVPFIALFLGYEAVRGIAPRSGIPVHYGYVIRVDRALFGGTDPSQWLQAQLGSVRWLAGWLAGWRSRALWCTSATSSSRSRDQ